MVENCLSMGSQHDTVSIHATSSSSKYTHTVCSYDDSKEVSLVHVHCSTSMLTMMIGNMNEHIITRVYSVQTSAL